MYDVICLGSATIDVYVKTEVEETLCFKKHSHKGVCAISYPVGSKILIKDLHFSTGGGGTNTSVSFSRMGLKTAYLGNIGNDENGNSIIRQLKKENVDFIGTRTNDITDYGLVLDSIEHDRTILVHKSASENLFFNKINKNRIKTKWIYSSSMIGDSFKTLKKIFDFAEKNNIKVAFNPSEYMINRYDISHLLKKTNVLVFNKEEAGLLAGNYNIKKLLKKIKKIVKDIGIITDGKNSAYAHDGKNFYSIKPHKVKVKETTGAGDAFASAFLAAMIKKNDMQYALKIGMINAESVITNYGAKNILLSWGKAIGMLSKKPLKIKRF